MELGDTVGRVGKNKGVTIQYDAFEFGDTCREFLNAGVDIETLANLFKRKPTTLDNWMKLSRIFPPEYRFEEIAPSSYIHLARAPEPLKAAQFVYDEFQRGYPMAGIEIQGFVDRWLKHKPYHSFILANYTRIEYLYRYGDGKGFIGYNDEEVAAQMGLSVDFLQRLRLQGKVPEFIISQDMKVIDYVLSLQERIEKLEQTEKPSKRPSASEINDFINRMEAEPENHTVEVKIIRKKGGRPAIDIAANKFLALYSKGLADGEIAEKMKISRRTVIRRREELGLKPNRASGQRGPVKKAL